MIITTTAATTKIVLVATLYAYIYIVPLQYIFGTKIL